ncbi:MAG: hypothetical protein WC744_03455 [Patescibacteria group bacterium]
MNQSINEKISVVISYNHEKNQVIPYKIRWQMREYFIKKLAFYHKVREGRTLIHIFHVTDGNLDFRLKFNSDDLTWILEEISDGYTV